MHLLDDPTELVPRRDGVLYSRDPKLAHDVDGDRYVVKNTESVVVLAETLGAILADLVGLQVPRWGLVVRETHCYFASRYHDDSVREPLTSVLKRGIPKGLDFVHLGAIAVFDQWIANTDRNEGNVLLCVDQRTKRPTLMAIDHDRALLLRGESELMLAVRPATEFLPKESLRDLFFLHGGFDMSMAAKIEALTDEEIAEAVASVGPQSTALADKLKCDYIERCVHGLQVRRRHLRTHMQEAVESARPNRRG